MKPLLIIGGGGLILYFLYSKGYFGSFGTSAPVTTSGSGTGTGTGSGSGTGAGAGSGGTTTGSGTGTGSGSGTPAQTLASIASRVQANAGAVPPQGLTPDGWNFSLNAVYPAAAAVDDPGTVFPGIDRTQPMPWSIYWASMGPVLGAHFGLSGLRGMGALPLGWS